MQEIERKFLVTNPEDAIRTATTRRSLRQGYLAIPAPDRAPADTASATVRVRIAGPDAWLTIKGPSSGIQRAEYEYPVPVAEAKAMLATMCVAPPVHKTRYIVPYLGQRFEVDVFHADNAPLVLAELELTDVDQPFELPSWIGAEVSHDARYFNASLARLPFSRW